jgi:hypothetical protein
VYFCGHYDEYGVVGYFTESVFTSGTGSVAYVKIPEIYTLKKMEVYTDPNSGNHTIAAVGEDPIDTTNYINTGIFIFEFSGINISYHYLNIPQIYYNRIYQDIAVTDNYIVASGQYDLVTNKFALTVIDKYNLTSLDAYTPIETFGIPNSWRYSIEYLENDDVAISTIVDQSGIVNYYSPVHIFDASTASFTNSQIIPLVSKAAPYNEMKYFPNYHTLLLLQTNLYPDESTTNSVIYYLKPYNTYSYPSLLIYDNHSYYYSLDRYSNMKVLATGELKSLSHSYLIHDIRKEPPFDCLNSSNPYIDQNTIPSPLYIAPFQLNDQLTNLSFIDIKTTDLNSSGICKQP